MIRDCKTCVFNTADGCVSWECEYINRDEAVEAQKFVRELIGYISHDDDDYISAEVICRKLYKFGLIEKDAGSWILRAEDADDVDRKRTE